MGHCHRHYLATIRASDCVGRLRLGSRRIRCGSDSIHVPVGSSVCYLHCRLTYNPGCIVMSLGYVLSESASSGIFGHTDRLQVLFPNAQRATFDWQRSCVLRISLCCDVHPTASVVLSYQNELTDWHERQNSLMLD